MTLMKLVIDCDFNRDNAYANMSDRSLMSMTYNCSLIFNVDVNVSDSNLTCFHSESLNGMINPNTYITFRCYLGYSGNLDGQLEWRIQKQNGDVRVLGIHHSFLGFFCSQRIILYRSENRTCPY